MDQNDWGLPKIVRILLVDDFDNFRRSMGALIELRPEWVIVAEAADGAEAVRLAQQLQPDIVILDIGLPILSGFAVARQMKNVAPNAKVIFSSANNTSEFVTEAFRAGARAYVYKQDALELLSAIDAVQRGQRFVSSSLDKSVLDELPDCPTCP
jgi:DNA-binding NarL/FixJ family response regulator